MAPANPQAPSFGTARAQGMSPFKRSLAMSRFESIAFTFVAGLAGLLTLATVVPFA
jgi:hypothetical protein